MSSEELVDAVLLAAGRSRRMGAFKPLLPFGDKSVVSACVDNLLEGGARRVVVVVGHRADEIERELARYRTGVLTAFNEEAGSEMSVSIKRGIEAVGEDARGVLVALVDQPAVPASAVREVVAAWRETRATLVIPTYDGRGGHPVLIDLSFRPKLLTLPPERGLRALFDEHRAEVLRLPLGSPYIVRDMDTWDQYAALHGEVFGRAPEVSSRGDA